ncbi:MAG: sigma-70 family RNA polymerase sigma factor [Thiolinea sp.]
MAQDQRELYSLLDSIRQEDQQALAAFYDATVGRVYGLALKVGCSQELAEEVVSDVYLQVWRSAGQYESQRATPLAWLLMMVRSRAIDALRREAGATRNRQLFGDETDISAEDVAQVNAVPEPLQSTLGLERGSRLATALELLDGKQRQLVALAFFRGMSRQEIAGFTDIPLGTVKSTLLRAQAILRGALMDSGLMEGKCYERVQ